MEKFKTDGIVIKSSVTGEADRIVWILTRNRGIIRAFAKGAQSIKSRLHAAASLFSYCDFVIFEKNGVFTVSDAVLREQFYTLRTELDRLTLAQYFCEIILKTVPETQSEENCLRLLLNSLFLLSKGEKDMLIIKSVFELRFLSETGFMPALAACGGCGEFQTPEMYFDCASGLLYCSNCGAALAVPRVPLAVISAMRHIVFSPFEKIFSFTLPRELTELLNRLSENYLLQSLQLKCRTLDFFKLQK